MMGYTQIMPSGWDIAYKVCPCCPVNACSDWLFIRVHVLFLNIVSLAISNVLSLLVSFVVTCVLYMYALVIGQSQANFFTKQFCKCKEKKNTLHMSSDAIVVRAINHAHISPPAQITSHQSRPFPFLLPHCLVSTPISNNNQPLLGRPPTVCFVVTPTAYRPWGVLRWFYIHEGCSLSSHCIPSLKLGLSHYANEAKFIHHLFIVIVLPHHW